MYHSKYLSFNNVDFFYKKEEKILNNVSFDLNKNEIVGILGKNGSGKSTILNLSFGLIKPCSGNIHLFGKPINSFKWHELSKSLVYVRQNELFIPKFYRVKDFILEGRRPYANLGKYSKNDKEIANKFIEIFGLENFTDRFVSTLSGGERQRVTLARAFCKNTKLVLLDEPTSAMDLAYHQKFFDNIRIIKDKLEQTILLSIHNINCAINNCDKVVILSDGKILFYNAPQKLSVEIISQAFQVNFREVSIGSNRYFVQHFNKR